MNSQHYTSERSSSQNSVYPKRPISYDSSLAYKDVTDPGVGLGSSPIIQIPASLVVTAAAFREFMRKNRLDEVVEGLLAGLNIKRMQAVLSPAAQIREVIRSSPLPDHLYHKILEGCEEMGYGLTVVWPVTMPVELFHYSKEYQQFPYKEATGPEEIIVAIRGWWASLFEPAAVFYRELNGQKHRDARITVAAQRKPDLSPS